MKQQADDAMSEDFSKMKAEELHTKLQQLERDLTHLKNENMLFASYLLRAQKEDRGADETGPETKGKKGAARKKEKIQELKPDEKYMIVKEELNYLRESIKQGKIDAGDLLDQLQSVINGTKETISGIKREAFDFKRDVVIGAESEQNGKVIAEKLIKYREKKMEEKDNLISKLREKNAALTAQLYKISEQIEKKTTTGDGLKYIDFHQLDIENRKQMKEIDEENHTLLKLKEDCAAANKKLKAMKDAVTQHEKELQRQKGLIKTNENRIKTAKNETNEVLKKIEEIKEKKRDLDGKASQFQNTSEVAYIRTKKELFELRKKLEDLKRSCAIHESLAKVLLRGKKEEKAA